MSAASADASPRVSVIVAARNASATLAACVKSVLALRYPPERLEVIVIDNDSTDSTPAVIGRFGDRIIALHETRRGPSAARNRGLAGASGDVIAFTDADCIVERAWLEHLVQPLADPAVGVTGGRILSHGPASPLARFGEEIHDHAAAIRQSPPYVITMNWASRKALLDEVGGFDETLLRGEDADLAYRIAQAGYRLVYVGGAIVYHRNPATLGALFHQGYLHGRASHAVRRIHAEYLTRLGVRIRPVRRVARDVAQLRDLRRVRRSFYRLVFDLGKVCGELAGELR